MFDACIKCEDTSGVGKERPVCADMIWEIWENGRYGIFTHMIHLLLRILTVDIIARLVKQ